MTADQLPTGLLPREHIDVHAHAVPLALLHALDGADVDGFSASRTDAGWVVDVPGVGRTRPVGVRMTDPEVRGGWLARAGIDTQILSPWMDIQDAPIDAATLRNWLRRLNEAMAAEAAASGGECRAMASVAITNGDQAAADLVEAADELGLAGLCLTTSPADGRALSDPSFEPLWAAAAERRIPVMLHPPTRAPSNVLPGIDGLGNVYGRLIDTTLAVADVILGGLLDRHDELRILLVHGGGFLPYQISRLDGGFRAGEAKRADLRREAPSAYLRDFRYDTVALSATAIRMLVAAVGADRVALGTDFPFPIGDQTPVDTIDRTELSPADRDAILGGTAEDLFGSPVAIAAGSRSGDAPGAEGPIVTPEASR